MPPQKARGTAPSTVTSSSYDRPKPKKASLINGIDRGFAFFALSIQGKVHHHDAVFRDDADQKDNTNERDNT